MVAMRVIPHVDGLYTKFLFGGHRDEFGVCPEESCWIFSNIINNNAYDVVFVTLKRAIPIETFSGNNSPSAFLKGGLGNPSLLLSFGNGSFGLVQRPFAENDRSDSAGDSDKSQADSPPPIPPFLAVMLAFLDTPMHFYGMRYFERRRFSAWFMFLGFITGTLGLGMCIADWGWYEFWPL